MLMNWKTWKNGALKFKVSGTNDSSKKGLQNSDENIKNYNSMWICSLHLVIIVHRSLIKEIFNSF